METYRVDFVEPIHVRLSDKGIDPSDQVDTGDEGWHACVAVFKMRSYYIPGEFTDVGNHEATITVDVLIPLR